MLTYVAAFALSFVLATGLTPLVRRFALLRGLIDGRSTRKVHSHPIPRLGGVAIVLAFFAPLVGLSLYHNTISDLFYVDPGHAAGFFGGGLAIALLGVYDDVRGAGAKLKFAVQFVVSIAMYFLGFQVHSIVNPFGAPFSLGIFALPFTLMWIVGVINAMNLIDGLDGLASGVAFFGVVTNLVVALSRGEVLMSLLMVALAGAILGFLIFNFNPASIFMGDTGSMFLGFILATSSMVTAQKGATAVSMLIPILALGLPIMDTLLAMIRRFVLGRSMFSADKQHIHHRLLNLGYTHRRAVLAMYAICVFFTLAGLSLTYASAPQAAIVLTVVCTVVFVLMRKLGYLDLSSMQDVGAARRHNLALRASVTTIADALREASLTTEIWESVQDFGETLGVSSFALHLKQASTQNNGEQFVLDRPGSGSHAFTEAVIPVEASGTVCGELVARWTDGRIEVSPDDAFALELLSDHIGRALTRAATSQPRIKLVR